MLRWAPALSRKRIIAASAGVLLAVTALGLAGISVWRAQRALTSSATQVSSASEAAFTVQQLSGHVDARFHRVLSGGEFQSAAEFAGGLFVCGRSSLTRYGVDGLPQQTWNVGAELPAHPLTTIAIRRGAGTPELWIGTDGAGVLIYDGQQFSQLLPAESGERKISALLPLSNGQVLLGTPKNGVYTSDGKRLKLLHSQFARTEVTALAGNEDEIWVGTRREGAWMWRSGEAVQFKTELPDAQVLSLYSEDGETWVGTPLGIAEFANARFRRPLAEGIFAQTLMANRDSLFVGTADEGVITVPLAAHPARVDFLAGEERAASSENITSLTKAGDDVLAVSRSAVMRLPATEPMISPAEEMLSAGYISALQVDSRGRLWIGYFDRGLDVLEPGSGSRLQHVEDDLVFCVNRIKEDPKQGNIGVATANGVAIFDAATQVRETFTGKNGFPSNHVSDLLFEPDDPADGGSLAMATPAGITFIEHGSVSSISAFQGLVNNHVYTLAGRDGTLLAGTLGGFSLLRNGSVTANFTTANSTLRQNWVTSSAALGNDIYLGTYGSGVIRVSRDSALTRFKEFARQRTEINLNAMLSTDRAIYAGTAGLGLAVLKAGGERWRFIRRGLPSLNVTAIASHNGVLYIGTDNGLVSATEREID